MVPRAAIGSAGKKAVEQRHKLFMGFNIGYMTAVRNQVKWSFEKTGSRLSRGGRNRVAVAMQHDGREFKLPKSGTEIVVAEAGPDLFNRSAGDPEWRHLPDLERVAKIGDNGELKDPLPVSIGVLLPEAAYPEPLPFFL